MTENVSRHVRETDPTLLRLKLLGQMEARTLTGESVLPVGGKTRALLAILALSDRKPVLRSRLAELLWSQRPEDMARASLRQEIHRLLDALSPLGVEVIDVQRHSLALKPALTSVDAERLLTASVRTIDSVVLPDEPLLSELAGVDPALDDWLAQQRERLSVHLQHVYENAIRELTEPGQVAEMIERLLKFDNLNEIAWRARIQSALHRGDQERAGALVDQMIHLFGDVDRQALSSETQSLIASMSAEGHSSEAVNDFGQTTLPTGGREPSFVAPIPRSDPMLALPLHYASRDVSSAEPRRISLVFLPPSCPDESLAKQGQDLRDQLELIFVHMGTFDILSVPEPSLPDPVNAAAVYRAWGTDYIISGSLRTGFGEADNRLIVRVLDARRGGIIIWGTHYDFASAGPDSAKNSLLAPAQAMQWNIFAIEARRIAARPDADLSALGMALRAFMLLLRHDNSLFGRIGALLERASDLEEEDGAIALIDALHCYIRFLNDWSADADAVFIHGLHRVRAAVSLMPDLHAVGVLLAAYLMYDPVMHATAVSVAQAAVEGISRNDRHHRDSPDYLMASIVLDLLQDKATAAASSVKTLLHNDCRSQLLELMRPVFMMVLLVGGDYQTVISMGRLMSGLYPACPSSLVYYLIALTEAGDLPEETQQVHRHLLRLVPDLTISKIVSRFPFIEKAHQKRLMDALGRAGLAKG